MSEAVTQAGSGAPSRAAVFSDVEGTLVDASLPTLAVAAARDLGYLGPGKRALLAALDSGERVLPRAWARRAQALKALLSTAGLTESQGRRVLDAFQPAVVARIKPAMLARLRGHQAQGLQLVLVSGGLHEAIAHLAAELGARGEGTRVRRKDGRFTARPDGPICQGEGKAQRARQVLAELGLDPSASHAYGDTASDIPFLQLFGAACAVDPDPVLEAEARRRGWEVLKTTG